ncbi:MAG: hypothetical protein ACSHYF_06225 [Verrucomicrobiaceae bacterium]
MDGEIISRPQQLSKMKTITTMLAASVALTVGALAAPAVIGATTAPEVVAADEKTVTLEVTGLK